MHRRNLVYPHSRSSMDLDTATQLITIHEFLLWGPRPLVRLKLTWLLKKPHEYKRVNVGPNSRGSRDSRPLDEMKVKFEYSCLVGFGFRRKCVRKHPARDSQPRSTFCLNFNVSGSFSISLSVC